MVRSVQSRKMTASGDAAAIRTAHNSRLLTQCAKSGEEGTARI